MAAASLASVRVAPITWEDELSNEVAVKASCITLPAVKAMASSFAVVQGAGPDADNFG